MSQPLVRDQEHLNKPTVGSLKYTPLSIACALFRNSQDGSSENPIDIVAILLSIEVDYHNNKATFLIGDPSLPCSTCAKICLRGSRNISLIVSTQIKQGDILRCNSLELRKGIDHEDFIQLRLKQEQRRRSENIKDQLPTVICEFLPSWKVPEAGKIIAKIDLKDENYFGSMNKEAVTKDWITLLGKWFDDLVTSKCPKGISQKTNISTTVPVSACRKRKLSSISNTNMLSDITVRIHTLHEEPLQSSSNKYKYQRAIPTNTTTAIISDGSLEEDTMILQQCQKFRKKLQTAISSKSLVSVTNLISTHPKCNFRSDRNNPDARIVLLPTENTFMTVLTHLEYNSIPPKKMLENARNRNKQKMRKSAISQWDTLAKSQMHHIATTTIKGRILDIVWDDLKVSIKDLDSPQKLVRALIIDSHFNKIHGCIDSKKNHTRHGPKYQYRETLITLASNLSSSMKIKANPEIMQILCGSVPPGNFKVKEGNIRNRIEYLVFELMQGMIKENIDLEWTINEYNLTSGESEALCVKIAQT